MDTPLNEDTLVTTVLCFECNKVKTYDRIVLFSSYLGPPHVHVGNLPVMATGRLNYIICSGGYFFLYNRGNSLKFDSCVQQSCKDILELRTYPQDC